MDFDKLGDKSTQKSPLSQNHKAKSSIDFVSDSNPSIKSGIIENTVEEDHHSIWSAFTYPVFVAGLGYFVDMFALTLFGVVRQQSVMALGSYTPAEALVIGKSLYSAQMIGMMVGGLVWGLIGDYSGRLKVLFGSIVVYSIGNILNAFVTDPLQYEICRFLTGFGLAGELGAAITLIAEIMPKESRGYGTTLIATLGLLGAVCAALVGFTGIPWDYAYIGSGIMGLALLAMRAHVFESGMFKKPEYADGMSAVSRLLTPLKRIIFSKMIFKYGACIAVGAPIYFITGTLMTFSPELTAGLGIEGVNAGTTLLWGTIGLAFGDLFSGLLSQKLRSRKFAIAICLFGAFAAALGYLLIPGLQKEHIYVLSLFMGASAGYWAVLITTTAEQFGTNLRSTATTTVPNFVRGAGALLLAVFVNLKGIMTTQESAVYLTVGVFLAAFAALLYLRESFGGDLDFNE